MYKIVLLVYWASHRRTGWYSTFTSLTVLTKIEAYVCMSMSFVQVQGYILHTTYIKHKTK